MVVVLAADATRRGREGVLFVHAHFTESIWVVDKSRPEHVAYEKKAVVAPTRRRLLDVFLPSPHQCWGLSVRICKSGKGLVDTDLTEPAGCALFRAYRQWYLGQLSGCQLLSKHAFASSVRLPPPSSLVTFQASVQISWRQIDGLRDKRMWAQVWTLTPYSCATRPVPGRTPASSFFSADGAGGSAVSYRVRHTQAYRHSSSLDQDQYLSLPVGVVGTRLVGFPLAMKRWGSKPRCEEREPVGRQAVQHSRFILVLYCPCLQGWPCWVPARRRACASRSTRPWARCYRASSPKEGAPRPRTPPSWPPPRRPPAPSSPCSCRPTSSRR